MNDTVCGPYLPRYIPSNITWYSMFCNLLSDNVKLCGLTINYMNAKFRDTVTAYPHIQSMMFCTDNIGLQ